MKFHPDVSHMQSIQAYGPGWVQVADEKLESSVVLTSRGERFPWHCTRFEDLSLAHFEQLAALQTELVIFGSGTRLRFPPAALIRTLIERQIGVETMDTQAACRTYNVLANEGRSVAVALLLES
ncbi:MAG: Mth938-like domain-containing protein [Rhodoferax sp.]|uniref:Mth938-like domain-containing protein n=1 Tax=Rhodoferax sp. TaxID=50421 RepID=UPI002621209B|nr:Mth938-like domain-containing protein [Rhodoferax sp.]MDD2880642.1 Mth938-like domain-containing protein [Rhodoferax sp.]